MKVTSNSIPVFSVVTVVYNGKNEVEKTIQSVINQSYQLIEYIIIDGGSTDGTMEIIRSYSNSINKVVSEKDNGIFDAMNKGLSLANGDFINFMNSGDTFASDDVITNICKKNPLDYGIIYGDTIKVTKYGDKLNKSNPFWRRKGIHEMGICHQSIFIKTKLAQKYSFDAKLKLSADYKMIFNIISKEQIKILYVEFPVSIFDAVGGKSSIHYASTYNEIITFIQPLSTFRKILFLYKSNLLYRLFTIYNYIRYSILK